MNDGSVHGVAIPFVPIGGIKGHRAGVQSPASPGNSFEAILQKELVDVRFSKHAHERIAEHQMQIDGNDLQKIDRAIAKAEEKGSQDSLVLLRDMAFIVSVRNRTVVTAIGADRFRENVFTKIDSAIVAE